MRSAPVSFSTICSPRPSMSMPPREAKYAIFWSRWAGQSGATQRVSASPSGRTSGLPQRGHTVGNVHGVLSRRPQRQHGPDHLGDHVTGLAHDDRVAGADVLERHLVLVVQRRHRRRSTRRRTPARARRTASPGPCARPTPGCRAGRVVCSSGGNLKAIAHRGARDVTPSRSRWARSSSLMTIPSIS